MDLYYDSYIFFYSAKKGREGERESDRYYIDGTNLYLANVIINHFSHRYVRMFSR